jgi:two-component system sensor histidine kinase/response regulator
MGIHVEPSAQSGRYDGLRVLVAEDNEVNQRLMGAVLRSWGIHPLIVSNGLAALAEVQRCHFNVILLDISMPIMDGITAIRYIRQLEYFEERQGAVVYFISSQHDSEDILATEAAGADGHLAKPLAIDRILGVIEEGLAAIRRPSRLSRISGRAK